MFEPLPGASVLVLSYGCRVSTGNPRSSEEHSIMEFHDRAELDQLNLPVGYRIDIDLWTRGQ